MSEPSDPAISRKALDGQSSAVDAARAVLALRLDSVEDRLEAAAERGEFDPRAVPQMRVATRRASSALRVFEPLVGPRIVRKVRKGLRKIRRSGEEARRCDVHTALLTETLELTPDSLGEACAFAIGRLAAERRSSLHAIQRLSNREPLRGLRRARRAAMAKLDQQAKPGEALGTFEALAAAVLPASLAALRSASSEDLSAIESVHALRLAEKRLRYDMEVLSPAAVRESALDKPVAALTKMQNRLGAVNDLCELVDRLSSWVDEPSMESATPRRLAEGLRALLEHEQATLAESHRAIIENHRLDSIDKLVDQISAAFGFAAPAPVVVVESSSAASRSEGGASLSASR